LLQAYFICFCVCRIASRGTYSAPVPPESNDAAGAKS